MNAPPLPDLYAAYIDCLNRRDWAGLGRHVDDEVQHNGRPLKLSGYSDMLVRNFEVTPDLRFEVQFLICDPPRLAVRLAFRCSPKGEFLGLNVDGRTVSFAEHAFYAYKGSKIVAVWSVLDKLAIEDELARVQNGA